MMKKTTILALAIVALMVVAGCVQPPQADGQESTTDAPSASTSSAKTVKVGAMLPLSGDAASYGESIKRGMELAQKELDTDGMVEVIYEDSKCDGKEAATAVNKLVSLDEVQVIMGEVCSGATLAATPVAEENQVVMVSPTASSPAITDAGEYIFRVMPSDALQGAFAAELVQSKGYETLAILYSNEDYGVGFEEVLSSSFTDLGGEVVASEAYERQAQDVRTQLTKIGSKNPDALFMIGNAPDSLVAALKQAKELSVDAAIFGSEAFKSEQILEGAANAAEGLVITAVTAGTSDFQERHEAEYGEGVGIFAAQGYDAFASVFKALEGGARSGTEIKTALDALEFDGATGNIDFDENGDVGGNYDVFMVKDGQFALVTE